MDIRSEISCYIQDADVDISRIVLDEDTAHRFLESPVIYVPSYLHHISILFSLSVLDLRYLVVPLNFDPG
jgi:hypothetical protein